MLPILAAGRWFLTAGLSLIFFRDLFISLDFQKRRLIKPVPFL